MQNVPQIVRERLKADVSASHPEANVLTAFAERLLGAKERASVVEHLARCGDCREIVALALPEIEAGQAVITPARSGWLAWPTFRWAFVTAGIAIIAVGALQYQRHNRPELSAVVAKRVTQSEQMATTSEKQPAETATPASGQVAGKKDLSTASSAPAERGRLAAPLAFIPKAHPQVGSGVGSGNGIHGGTQTWRSTQNPAQGESFFPTSAAKLPAEGKTNGNVPAASQNVMMEAQSEAVTVDAGKQVVALAPSPALKGYSGGIGKAKAAIVAAQDSTAPAAPRWSISATGGLQRSYDLGNTWQNIDVNAGSASMMGASLEVTEKSHLARRPVDTKTASAPAAPLVFRAVAANGGDVWAGGSNAALFHSTDSGDHWTRVSPSSAGTLLSGDVVGLDFPSPQNGSISTSSGEVWTTNDGGQSWQKQ